MKIPSPPVKGTLFAHQKEAYARALHTFEARGGYGLLFEMGLGKSLTAIAIMGEMYLEGKIARALVIAPKSVCPVWEAEFGKWANYPHTCKALTGTSEEKAAQLTGMVSARFTRQTGADAQCAPLRGRGTADAQCAPLRGRGTADAQCASIRGRGTADAQCAPLRVAVVNYESVWREGLAGALANYAPDIVICDESQRIKDSQAKQSKAIHKLGFAAKFRMILSGTPIGNSPLDVFSQYKFLDWSVFGKYFMPFRARYATMGGMRVNGKPVQVVGYKNLEELSDKCYSVASRATKQDALDLPEKTFIRQPVEMSERGKVAYACMVKDSFVWLDEHETTATNVLTRLLRLQQITGGFLTDEITGKTVALDRGKLDALSDIIRDYVIDGGGKLVVFARFRAEIEAILEMLKAVLPTNGCGRAMRAPTGTGDGGRAVREHTGEGDGGRAVREHTGTGMPGKLYAVCISGSVSQQDREKAVSAFQTDPDCRVFVGQTQAAAEGITLHASHMMVFYSVDFSFTRYAQAQDRIHRIGQKAPCTYVNLCCPGTIDEDALNALEGKRDLAVSVLDDGWRRLFHGEG